jgi:hypothetical protein
VAYELGLVTRRASELYPGEAKTDRRDRFVLADTARTHAHRLHWLEPSDERIEELRVLAGYDDDLSGDSTRTVNRLRDLLLSLAPALERVLGRRLEHPAARALLARYPTPTALRGAKRGQLVRLAKGHAPRMRERLVDGLLEALSGQTVTVPAEQTAGRVIAELAEELDRLAGRRDQLEREIVTLSCPTLRRRSCSQSRESGSRPAPGSSPRSVTSTDSRPRRSSPPTPGSPQSPANPAARSAASRRAGAATSGSRTRSGSRRSARCATSAPPPTTPANERKARNTTPP